MEIIGIDGDGFDLQGDDQLLRSDFPAPILNPSVAPSALVELARIVRA